MPHTTTTTTVQNAKGDQTRMKCRPSVASARLSYDWRTGRHCAHPLLGVGALASGPAVAGARNVGRRVEDRCVVLLEDEVLGPRRPNVSRLPAAIPLLGMQQAFAHVLVFPAPAARPFNRRLILPEDEPILADAEECRGVVARAESPCFGIGGLHAEMHGADEEREEQRHSGCGDANASKRSRAERQRPGIGRVDPDAEEQPADERHDIEKDVAHVADAAGDEPLQPLFERADGDAGQ